MKKNVAFSFDDLNLNKKCEEAVEVEYVMADGTKTGVFLSVIGKHAEKVQRFSMKHLDKMRAFAENSNKQGKSALISSEENLDYIIKDAAIRIAGWRGINQEFSPEGAEQLCRINSEIRQLVVDTSNDLANFTKSK